MSGRDYLRSILMIATAVFVMLICQTAWGDIAIVRDGKATAIIRVDKNSGNVLDNAARILQEEIHRRTGVNLPIAAGARSSGLTSICLGTASRSLSADAALAKLGLKAVTSSNPGKEGFQLASGRVGNKQLVVVNGCDDLGTLHGVGWLLRRMDFSDGRATLPSTLRFTTAPATEMRYIRFGDPFGWVNADLAEWKYVWGEYALWGLSGAVFWCDPAHQGDPRESDLARGLWNKWTDRVPLARSLGLDVIHLTQSNLAFKDGEFGPTGIPNFEELHYMCPDFNGINPKFPRGREALRTSRKWFFDHMPHIKDVDYFLTSGWDGGGCTDPDVYPWSCTYANLVDTILYPEIAAHNPKARIILGLYQVYIAPGFDEIATKFRNGWNPKWLYGLEFDDPCVDKAPLFPKEIKKFYFPLWTTDRQNVTWYQSIAANPAPAACQKNFDHIWNDCGIRAGTACYSEGPHDYMNQIMIMRMAWDPKQSADSILDEICRYYFGNKAAPKVKEICRLMENEDPESLTNPRIDPRVQELVRQAERVMPGWAKSSWQWEMIVGRAGIDRTRRRQADLMPEFDKHWQRYRSLIEADAEARPEWLDETRTYFRNVALNAREMHEICKRANERAFRPCGGGQMSIAPDPRAGEAVEAFNALKNLKPGARLGSRGRWCVGYLDFKGRVCVADGWSNKIALKDYQAAADAQLVFADLEGRGSKRIVFLGQDGRLHSWSPVEGAKPLAEGDFLTGPLAAGDLDGNGREEVVALGGKTEKGGYLAVVNGAGKVTKLETHPAGLAPDVEAKAVIVIAPTRPHKAANISYEPRVQVADWDGDGRPEIICSDRDNGSRLTVLSAAGKVEAVGPKAPAGAVAAGDLNGDGAAEVVFLDGTNRLAVFAKNGGVTELKEAIRPKWLSTVAVMNVGTPSRPGVVYADPRGMLRYIYLKGPSRSLCDLPSSVAIGPGMKVGDFDGDGRQEVCYLRRKLSMAYPLSTLSVADGAGGLRDLPLSVWYEMQMKPSFGAPLGPRASGLIRLPTIDFSWEKEHRFVSYNAFPED